jgi:predicted nuclease of predicted toxin-antitoxin system
MKFPADMGISPKTSLFLAEEGHDAVHLHECGMDCSSDTAILETARNERRVLLTHDLDFGDLMAASGAGLPSVIVFRLRNMHPEMVNRNLREVIHHHQDALVRGAVISVSDGQIRVRLLPVKENEP